MEGTCFDLLLLLLLLSSLLLSPKAPSPLSSFSGRYLSRCCYVTILLLIIRYYRYYEFTSCIRARARVCVCVSVKFMKIFSTFIIVKRYV